MDLASIMGGSLEIVLGGNAVVLSGIFVQLARLSTKLHVMENDMKWLKQEGQNNA